MRINEHQPDPFKNSYHPGLSVTYLSGSYRDIWGL
ncbi:hypothetical protein M2103_002443 [Ereboglobus sp. PH5-5]|nr:hypothetical protein [Ereboglobus sp. PH5-5]